MNKLPISKLFTIPKSMIVRRCRENIAPGDEVLVVRGDQYLSVVVLNVRIYAHGSTEVDVWNHSFRGWVSIETVIPHGVTR